MNRKILAFLAAAPLALGVAGIAHADEAISDTRISNHGAPTETFPSPIYSSQPTMSGDEDTGRVSAHEAHPQNPGNTSHYRAPPIVVTQPAPIYVQPGTPVYVTPGAPSYVYTPPGSAGPQVQIISNEPYFQDDVPPYRR